ncbi:MAG: M23 family metallopeptidase [Candidatus Melainabacteria bacterium]|nr:MAG: M23 family metallopeptidase [Candidatus Melainabacteria bacterium]
MGTPVKASNSGRVIYVGWYGGYGKVVIIDHGQYNGKAISTLYAHLSRYNVSVGQKIAQGQKIGNAGSTGYSTGLTCILKSEFEDMFKILLITSKSQGIKYLNETYL